VLKLKLDQDATGLRTRQIEDRLVQSLSKYFARDIRVVFDTSTSALDTPARQRSLADQERIARAARAFEEDPAVKGLRERFGAEVDSSSVKPAN
jgi:hypothetical protein